MIVNIEENKEREREREEGNEKLFCALLCIDAVFRRIRKMQHVTVSCRGPTVCQHMFCTTSGQNKQYSMQNAVLVEVVYLIACEKVGLLLHSFPALYPF